MKIILGSGSPRRYELMSLLKVPFTVLTSDEEEIYHKDMTVYDQCCDISYHKALNVYNKTKGNRIVIGADTIVVFNDEIFGKPKDKIEASKMIHKLSGNCHEVVTAITLLISDDEKHYEEKLYEITKVYIDKLSDEEIDNWIKNNNVCDKAGAYAIQEEFGKHVTKIDGDYFNIVGLPINKLYNALKKYSNKVTK